jgi:hypothetical protein
MPELADGNTLVPLISSAVWNYIGTENYPVIEGTYQAWRFSTVEDICANKAMFRADTCTIISDEDSPPVYPSLQVEPDNKTFPPSTYAYRLVGSITDGNERIAQLIIFIGTVEGCRTINSLIQDWTSVGVFLKDDSRLQLASAITPAKDLVGVNKVVDLVIKCSERQLYKVLRDTELSRSTRVMTTFATLYPYILDHIPSHIRIMEVSDSAGAAQAEEERRSGGNMGLLGLHILGPAYSRADKLAEQVSKRISSASVSEGIVSVDTG